MKIAIVALLIGSAAAFAPAAPAFRTTCLSAAPGAAKSAEEDLVLTRAVILAHMDGDDAPPAEVAAAVEEPKAE